MFQVCVLCQPRGCVLKAVYSRSLGVQLHFCECRVAGLCDTPTQRVYWRQYTRCTFTVTVLLRISCSRFVWYANPEGVLKAVQEVYFECNFFCEYCVWGLCRTPIQRVYWRQYGRCTFTVTVLLWILCSRFVRYANPESVLKAVQEVCEWMLRGKSLKVEIASESREALRLVLSGECLSTVVFSCVKGDTSLMNAFWQCYFHVLNLKETPVWWVPLDSAIFMC